ncbi:MAG TPA: GAF domain-containing protein, partial [Aggregatilineales bacterium]|nr:GAF domain-containing protein [Aggregatilineales bacterium]
MTQFPTQSPLARVLRPRHDYANLIDQQRAATLIGLAFVDLFLAGVALVAYFPGRPLSVPSTVSLFLVAGLSLVSGIVVWLCVNGGSLFWGSLLYVVLLFVRATIVSIPPNPNYVVGSFVLVYSLPIIGAGLLFNRRAMALMIAACTVALTLITLLNAVGLLYTTPGATPMLAVVLFNVVILAADGLLLSLFSNTQADVLRNSLRLTDSVRSAITLGNLLAPASTLDEMFIRTVGIVRERLGFHYAQVFLIEETTGLIVQQVAIRGLYGELRQLAPDAPGILPDVIRSGTTRLITSRAAPVDRTEMLTGIHAQLLIPLHQADKVIGLLDVQSVDDARFSPQMVEILEAVAAQLVIAIENIHLKEDKRDLERQQQVLSNRLATSAQLRGGELGITSWAHYVEEHGGQAIGYDWQRGTLVRNTALTPSLQEAMSTAMPDIQVTPTEKILSVPIMSRGQALGAMEFRV